MMNITDLFHLFKWDNLQKKVSKTVHDILYSLAASSLLHIVDLSVPWRAPQEDGDCSLGEKKRKTYSCQCNINVLL